MFTNETKKLKWMCHGIWWKDGFGNYGRIDSAEISNISTRQWVKWFPPFFDSFSDFKSISHSHFSFCPVLSVVISFLQLGVYCKIFKVGLFLFFLFFSFLEIIIYLSIYLSGRLCPYESTYLSEINDQIFIDTLSLKTKNEVLICLK